MQLVSLPEQVKQFELHAFESLNEKITKAFISIEVVRCTTEASLII
jgi:hypothetical protein